ncbi:hypothetical protein [Selenomonas sp.]|uniref:hypothetical protein n=1 Tax=Selenomonas sp. TaxID=2053611 RepID=UPI0025E01EE1|nr:hypothetical protein [Selenomonas sp.]MCI6086246.1 hypothetical protein [Selenomonas sp.]MCI6283813.1 hypothetical protein [Selenomonas sp.]MDY3298016.1 hypothetical protein [Selenomonas sp.]MDY4417440.1 hypothetical protein [Selenomonas sp.]
MASREEEKHERFRRVAENRTNRVLDTLRLLGNCANTGNYSYTKEEVASIFQAIEQAVAATKKKFDEVQLAPEDERFRLPD